MRSVNLIEAPQKILCCFIDITATRVVGEIVAKWRSSKLFLEDINLV